MTIEDTHPRCPDCGGVLDTIGCCRYRPGQPTYKSGFRCAMMGDRVRHLDGRTGVVAITMVFSILWDGETVPDYKVSEDDILPE